MSTVDYEGGDALMNILPEPQPMISPSPPFKLPTEEPPEAWSPEESGDSGSEDDYVAESAQKKVSASFFSKYQTPLSKFYPCLLFYLSDIECCTSLNFLIR